MNYTSVEKIQEATHWMSLPDFESPLSDSILPHKAYELIKMKDDIDFEDYFIIDENGDCIMAYIAHKGFFAKERIIK